MGSPSYLIAKYVADLFRNEPKNIGIIVWLDGFTEARFLATADGKVNGRYLPDSINVASYRQWIEYWTKSIAKEKFKEIGTSKQIERASPEFLDALLSTGSGNYVLERGGELLEEVEPSGLGDVASFLFSRLVSSEESAKSVSAEKVRDDLLKDAHIASSPLVKTNKRIPITTANGGTIHHEFHLWIGNGSPEFLAHVVPLTNHPRAVKQAADALVLRFERVVQAGKVDPKKCIALTYSVEERDDEMIDESLLELGSVAQVFDVQTARADLLKLLPQWVETAKQHAKT